MKNVRLFPKTFLYVFSLMAAVVLVSHALFYFMMPVAYTWQKDTAFKKNTNPAYRRIKRKPELFLCAS